MKTGVPVLCQECFDALRVGRNKLAQFRLCCAGTALRLFRPTRCPAILAILLALAICGRGLAAEPLKPGEKSTDDALRESLDAHAGDDYDRALLGEPKKADATKDHAADDLAKRLKQELGAAAQREDPQEDLLLRAVKDMHNAQARLAQGNSDAITQHDQRQAVGNLEKLIEQARKSGKCCGQPLSPNPQPAGKPGGGPQTGPKPDEQANANTPSRGGNPNAKRDFKQESAERKRLAVQRMREQYELGLQRHSRNTLFELPSDYFLPEYEGEIEDYFRRLSGGKPASEENEK